MVAVHPRYDWVIERGAAHPLVQKAEGRVAYVPACSGHPIEILEQVSDRDWVCVMELFTSREMAESAAAEIDESDDEADSVETVPTHVMELSGESLLESIARMERLDIVIATSGSKEIFKVRGLDHYGVDYHERFEQLMALLPIRGSS
jgi:hypothetical protein